MLFHGRQHVLFRLILVGLFVLLSFCAQDPSASHEDTYDSTTDLLGEGQVGTIIGNPNPRGNSMTLKIQNSQGASVNKASQSVSAVDDCLEFVSEKVGGNESFETQVCSITTQKYRLGILAIHLIGCIDKAGLPAVCDKTDGNPNKLVSRTELYKGPQVDLDISTQEAAFPSTMASFDQNLTVGGLQMIIAYFQSTFPDVDSDPLESAKVISQLQGKSYRICMTATNTLFSQDMETRCGNAEAVMGDMLVDINNDGVFGFIDTNLLTADIIEETPSWPQAYPFSSVAYSLLRGNKNSDLVPVEDKSAFLPEYATRGFSPVGGFMSPIFVFPFSSVESINAGVNYNFDITLDLWRNMSFIDGISNVSPNRQICVDALTTSECPGGDDDPNTVGLYHPYFDGMIYPFPPGVKVTMTPE